MKQLKITHSITKRESGSLDTYLKEIGKIDLLTPEEEVEIARKIKTGDTKAREQLTEANLRFVVSVAKQYQNQGLSLSDLINEGNIGLIKAAQHFDETRGFRFISYAVWWIRQHILSALATQTKMVKMPLNKVSMIHKINNAKEILIQELQREPNAKELAQYTGYEIDEISTLQELNQKHLSLDAPLTDETTTTLIDILDYDSADIIVDTHFHYKDLHKEIENILNISWQDTRTPDIIKMYFGIDRDHPMSLDDIGEHFGLTRERVRQLKDKGLQRLRSKNRSKLLKHYLGK